MPFATEKSTFLQKNAAFEENSAGNRRRVSGSSRITSSSRSTVLPQEMSNPNPTQPRRCMNQLAFLLRAVLRREGFAYNLIQWATFRLQKVKKQRERWKNKARKGKDEKEDKTLKREKPPHLVRGFFWVIFTYKTGENWNFDHFLAHWLRLWPRIYTNFGCFAGGISGLHFTI